MFKLFELFEAQIENSKFTLKILSHSLQTSYAEFLKDPFSKDLLFVLYINDMLQAIDCKLLLYADLTCLIF